MWSDNEAKVDLLRFNYLCSSVNKIIMNDQLSPTTIGLFGDWGSGKSTLLNLSKLEVEKNKNALWVEFNGWLFEGYSDAKTALMGAILDQIKKRIENDKTIPEKTLDLVKKLSKKVNWFSVLVSSGKYAIPALAGMPHITAGIAIGDAVKFIREQVKDIPHAIEKIDEEKFKSFFKDSDEQTEDVRKSIREFREDFAKLINESKLERLVVSIDDLDRCLPDTVIETLEAIRLFLFVPKTVFLIAADERLVEYAVTKRFPKLPTGSNLDVGREYLEKMIQVPIRVPSLNPLDMKSYMNLLVAERHITDKSNFDKIVSHVKAFTDPTFSKCSFDLEAYKSIISTTVDAKIEEDFKLVNQVSGILTVGLNGSPRRIKRFLNTLLLRMEMATFKGISLRRDILAKIMLLEYLRPAFFKELSNFQALEDVKSLSLKDYEESVNKKELRKNSQPNQNWISDEWMQMWLKTEPLLADVDLRPYFYIAHDRLGSMGHLQNRMSPAAQTALSRLLSKEDITRKSAAKEIKGFAESDIGAIFDSLSERISRIEELDESVEEKAVELLIEAVPKLIPQVISMYSLMDVELVPLGTIVFLEKHCISTDSWPSCENLFKAWAAQNDNKVLKNAAAQRLKQAASAQGKK